MTVSYVHGASEVPLKYQTIGAAFDEVAQFFAARDALIVTHQGVRWSYAELSARVDGFAAALLALGLTRGDRIGIWAPNCSEWLVTQLASAKAGLILVNINPSYRLSELEFCLRTVGCRALVTAARLKSSDYLEMLGTLLPELGRSEPGALRADRLPQLRTVIRLGGGSTPGCLNFDDLQLQDAAAQRALREVERTLQPDDAANIQFTSGTTGLPKGATLSHDNLLNNGYFVGRGMRLTEHDRICIPVPLYHCFGMVMGNLAAITHGAAMIYPAECFDAGLTLSAVARERATALYGVPTMFIAELDHPDFPKYDLTSLRTGMMAGAPCPVEIMRRCIRDMNLTEITIGYGMTETSPVSTQTRIGDALEKQVASVGRAHPHIEIKIIDANGRIVPRGVTGEFCTRGYSVMLGYWEDTEKTAEAIDQAGWMHTGDLATMDADGYCAIVGRIKDLVIRGGENIYPREVEEFLYRHPAIVDVQVFGVPDQRFGEELCAWIKLRAGQTLTEDEVKAFCKDQIAHYKVPRYVRFVEDFPMTVTGKMQKYLMRATMTEELGLR